MSQDHQNLVAKVWNYAHVLRDQGVSYGDYVEQITYLLFLKMDQERDEFIGEPSAVPKEYRWSKLASLDGEAMDVQYRKTLEALSKRGGLIGVLFHGAQNKLSDPAKLKRVVSLIDKETWIGLNVDTKGEIYEETAGAQCVGGEIWRRAILHAPPANPGHRGSNSSAYGRDSA